MSKGKPVIKNILVFGVIAAAAVAAIGFKSFGNNSILLIAVGVTFAVVVLTLLVLNAVQKDDGIEPGKPKLK